MKFLKKFIPKLTLVVITCLFVLISSVEAATRVRGYIKRSGTYVAPHYKSDRDSSKFNNYSTKGNTNPFTGKKGYTNPYSRKYR